MFKRYDDSSYFDFEQDRDLIAQMNETRDPAEMAALTRMSRQRLRQRRIETRRAERSRGAEPRRFARPRLLTFRAS